MGYLHYWVWHLQSTIHKKEQTAFNLRLNNHRNHIKKGVSSCELTEHFLHNERTHNVDNNVIITIIEQITKDDISNEQKKKISLDTGRYSSERNWIPYSQMDLTSALCTLWLVIKPMFYSRNRKHVLWDKTRVPTDPEHFLFPQKLHSCFFLANTFDVAVSCWVIDHRWHQNVVRTKSGTRGVAECATDFLTTFWRLLWSIVLNQTHGNMESICFI